MQETGLLAHFETALASCVTQQEAASRVYIDGHHKPMYADKLIPRGLIGCSGKILGCRALALLHDEQGHLYVKVKIL